MCSQPQTRSCPASEPTRSASRPERAHAQADLIARFRDAFHRARPTAAIAIAIAIAISLARTHRLDLASYRGQWIRTGVPSGF